MSIEVDTVTAPAYWASYLVNGDASGIDDDRELARADSWIDDLASDGWYVVSCEGEAEFDCYQDVIEYVIHRVTP